MIARAALALAAVLATLAAAAGPVAGASVPPLRAGPLTWQTAPLEFRARGRGLTHDRVVLARVRNTSDQAIMLWAKDVRVRDSAGHRMRSVAGFTNAYAHGLFGAFQQPSAAPTKELLRMGRMVQLEPGEAAPFFAAWRIGPAASRGPARVDYGTGDLLLPAKSYLAAK